MRVKYNAHMGMCDRHRADREDWVTSQYVDRAIDMLECGASHEEVQLMLLRKLVPVAIQRRVLAGQAARRHKEKVTP